MTFALQPTTASPRLAILRALGRREWVRPSQLADRCRLPVATVRRCLHELAAELLVVGAFEAPDAPFQISSRGDQVAHPDRPRSLKRRSPCPSKDATAPPLPGTPAPEPRRTWINPVLIQVATRHLQIHTGRESPGDAPRKISARDLAQRFDLFPLASSETRRRRVRELVDAIRREGFPIAADGEGIWYARTPEDHELYQAWRRKHGLAHLAAAGADKRSAAAAQAAGQRSLFQ